MNKWINERAGDDMPCLYLILGETPVQGTIE